MTVTRDLQAGPGNAGADDAGADEPAAFEGFVSGGAPVTLPAQLFAEVLPEIEDPVELRVTLHALFAIARQRGARRMVRRSQLASSRALRAPLERDGEATSREAVARGLEAAVARGVLLECALDDGDALYVMNNDAGRRALLRVRAGAVAFPGGARPLARSDTLSQRARPASVYEQEVGVLTPSVAEALEEAVARYPEDWVVEALRESARSNARSWRYAEAILRRWERAGRIDPRNGGANEEGGGAHASTRGAAAGGSRDHGPYERIIRRS